jgi:putative ABC transport system ATP-binding protein
MFPSQARGFAEISLAELGLADMEDRYPDQLSGGEQQRVAIARGLVGPRKVLLADEPTGALDETTSESILRALRARCDDGAAALLVTHEPAYAAWADRVVRLRDGRVEGISERVRTQSTADLS